VIDTRDAAGVTQAPAMRSELFTIIDDGVARTVPATIAGERVRIGPAALRDALGWQLEPEGLCRGATCIPTAGRPELAGPDGVDLGALAAVLERPLALDLEERTAWLGVAAAERAAHLRSLVAPDFTLPDLDGRLHTLSQHRGKKVLLVAYASW
jgi:hypothetical protein